MDDWTTTGGYYRDTFESNGLWRQNRAGQWTKEKLVPFGKACVEYRDAAYRCPVELMDGGYHRCDGALQPDRPYVFRCVKCETEFNWTWGSLIERF